MIEINTVDWAGLNMRLPSERMGVVLAQPFLSLTAQEPFVTQEAFVEHQLSVVMRTLEVAANPPASLGRTHLTVFPEYAIPGLEGVRQVLQKVGEPQWPNATVIVGGVHALSKAQYAELCQMPGAHCAQANAPDQVDDNEWVNCSVTIVKDGAGEISFWVQPKVWPAWEEQHIQYERMFRGRAINVFQGQLDNELYFRLVSIICFDWIATVETKSPIDWVINALNDSAGEGQLPLTWALVIQNNPKPSHRAFLDRVRPFFDQRATPKVPRDNAALFFCNSAGNDKPGKAKGFGSSSVLHSKRAQFQSSHNTPTVSGGGKRFRDGSDTLLDFNDSVFREGGACIHSFVLNNAAVLPAGAAGRSFAIEDARVHAFREPCPRAPNAPVPASIKWLQDFLDSCKSIGADFEDAPLAGLANEAHGHAVAYLRTLDGRSASALVETASGTPREKGGADDWDENQEQSIQHVANSLDILISCSADLHIGVSELHASITIEGSDFDVLALVGRKHEDCLSRARLAAASGNRQLVLVTRDKHNTLLSETSRSFLDDKHDGEGRYTFPGDSKHVVGFQNLLGAFRAASDQPSLAALVQELMQ